MKRNILLAAGAAIAAAAGVQVFAADAGIRPGEYEVKTRLMKIDMPGLPASAQQKQQKGVGKVETFKRCVTPEDAQAWRLGESKNCRNTQQQIAGGKLNIASQCMGGSTQRVVGTYTPTSYNLTMTTSGGQGAARMTMVMNSTGRRIGDCAAEDSGDEE